MEELDTIDVELKYLKIVKSVFARHLPYKQVWAYGSRVKWTAMHTSDLDCVVFGATDSEIADAKEAFDESDVPFEVQLLNWETIPDDFRENIMKQYFVLQNNKDWKETTLGEIAEIIGGGTPKTSVAEYWNGNIPWITPRDLTKFTNAYISRGERNISYLGLQKSAAKLMPTGAVLLTSRAPIGYIAIAKNDVSTNQGFKSLVVDNKKVHNVFIYYWLKDNVEHLQSKGSGTTFIEISGSVVKEITISIPPLPEQKAIASVLSSLDYKIDLLHRQNKTLESIAKTLFRQWFIEEANDDWEEGKLGDFIAPKKGKNITKSQAIDGQYPVIAGDLNPSCYHNQCNTSAPVITISASGANAGFVNLYYIPIWSSDSSFVDSTTTTNVYFFYMFLKYFQESIYDKQEGSAQPHIYPSHLMNLDILKYPLVLIENYEINVTPFFDKIAKNQKQIKTLESLRDILLPKLMSGDVRVEYEAAA